MIDIFTHVLHTKVNHLDFQCDFIDSFLVAVVFFQLQLNVHQFPIKCRSNQCSFAFVLIVITIVFVRSGIRVDFYDVLCFLPCHCLSCSVS